MQVIYHFDHQQTQQVHQLYQQAWWAKQRSLSEVAQCINGSQLCVGLLDQRDQLLGFTRVISDYIFKAIIFDVIVDDAYQGAGLGKQLLSLVKAHPSLQKVQHFELYCLPEMYAFYEQQGFTSEVGGIQLMRFTVS